MVYLFPLVLSVTEAIMSSSKDSVFVVLKRIKGFTILTHTHKISRLDNEQHFGRTSLSIIFSK